MIELINKAEAMMAVQKHFNEEGFNSYSDGQKMLDRIVELPIINTISEDESPRIFDFEKEFSILGFTNEMRRIMRNKDKEDRHYEADMCMCRLLEELGYGEGVEIFKKAEKWYA